MGTFFACDELLTRCDVNCPDIIVDDQKPARKGYWLTEIVLTTEHGFLFLIHSELKCTGDKGVKILENWIDVMKSMNWKNSILLFDGYYSSAAAIQAIEDSGVKAIGSIRPNIIGGVSDHEIDSTSFMKFAEEILEIKTNVETRQIIYSTPFTTRGGVKSQKFGYSNIFRETQKSHPNTTILPEDLTTLYHDHFNACDRLNRNFADYQTKFLNFKYTNDKPDTGDHKRLGVTMTKFGMKAIFHNIRVLTLEWLLYFHPRFDFKRYTAGWFARDITAAFLMTKYHNAEIISLHYNNLIPSSSRSS